MNQELKSAPTATTFSWSSLKAEFHSRCRSKNISPRTWGLYCWQLDTFIDWAGHRAPGQITRSDIEQYLAYKRQEGWGDDSIHGACRVLKTFWKHCSASGMGLNPTVGLAMPKCADKIPVAFTREQFAALVSSLDTSTALGLRDYALLVFYADTGLRLNEALGIRLNEFNVENRSVKVLGKGNKERIVQFGTTAAYWAGKWLRRTEGVANREYVWINRYGGRLTDTSFSQRLKKLTIRAGIARFRLSAHALRHFFAIDYLRNGGDPKSLQEILGHTTLEMTMHYVNWAGSDMAAIHQKASPVDNLLGGHRPRKILL